MRIKHFYCCVLYLHIRGLGIIYEDKSTINVNEVKEHLLNKDKVDTQLTGESHNDDSGQVRVIMEVPRVTQNIGI